MNHRRTERPTHQHHGGEGMTNKRTMVSTGALFSECGTYRYRLWRSWDHFGRSLPFIMLNPSTADATTDDPTIRRCIGFAEAWGYTGILVLNLFALRATDPSLLYKHPDPIGPDNDGHLHNILRDTPVAIAGWGVHGALKGRGDEILSRWPRLQCLGLTKDGQPRHPLYLPRTVKPFGVTV